VRRVFLATALLQWREIAILSGNWGHPVLILFNIIKLLCLLCGKTDEALPVIHFLAIAKILLVLVIADNFLFIEGSTSRIATVIAAVSRGIISGHLLRSNIDCLRARVEGARAFARAPG
jgi:hypothetical protein